MRLTDRSLYHKLFLNPELHAGEAYMDGRMSLPELDPARLPDAVLDEPAVARSLSAAEGRCGAISRGLKRFQQANKVGEAQKNVAHHYDLGNDFYRLFLDEGMQYSCAYFVDDTTRSRRRSATSCA